MNKRIFVVLFLAIIIILPGRCFCEDELKEKVTLDIVKDKKSEVTLEHKRHVDEFEVKCKECHHEYNPKNGAPKPCIECHDFETKKVIEGRKADLIKTSVMKNVYHDTCHPCHEKLERKGKVFSKKCSVCHEVRIE